MKWNLNNWKNSFEMRNVKIFIIMISIPLLHSCNNEKTSVIVNLELVKNESSIYENQIKISIQNLSDSNIYIANLSQNQNIIMLDESSTDITNDVTDKEIKYFEKHFSFSETINTDANINSLSDIQHILRLNAETTMYNIDSIRHNTKFNDYLNFVDSAYLYEMRNYLKAPVALNYCFPVEIKHNTESKELLESILKLKYSDIVLIPAKGTVYDYIPIDSLVVSGKKCNVFLRYINYNRSQINAEQLDSCYFEWNEKYLDKINGYSLFKGELKSNTIVINQQ